MSMKHLKNSDTRKRPYFFILYLKQLASNLQIIDNDFNPGPFVGSLNLFPLAGNHACLMSLTKCIFQIE